MKEFILDTEYIELIKLLKLLRIAATGGHAKILVEDGCVIRNGEIEYRKRAKIIAGDVLTIDGQTIVVK